mmetsp:Transcript_23942/g.60622  ORF Transcript_23942/g.60622 Transcript_23942/m.60622 type:complete len:146 (-) Transcript_23942:2156-2593(-)
MREKREETGIGRDTEKGKRAERDRKGDRKPFLFGKPTRDPKHNKSNFFQEEPKNRQEGELFTKGKALELNTTNEKEKGKGKGNDGSNRKKREEERGRSRFLFGTEMYRKAVLISQCPLPGKYGSYLSSAEQVGASEEESEEESDE